ncbi:MAG: hypothetical protein R2843_13185 [Thermomicrobiales bacterium]
MGQSRRAPPIVEAVDAEIAANGPILDVLRGEFAGVPAFILRATTVLNVGPAAKRGLQTWMRSSRRLVRAQ